jgi:glycosyltransferase involved in cell wall biosynthesis
MKILSLTAGAANMYCGSCLRDNALAGELRRQGHDITLLPVYTPAKTDEPSEASADVLFGGISVYLQQRSSLFRHTPKWLDRLWDSPWALRAASRRSLPVDPRLLGEMTVAMLAGDRGPLAKEFDKLRDWLTGHARPDVVTLPNTLLISLAPAIKSVFTGPVCCTMQGEDLFLDHLEEPWRSQSLEMIARHAASIDAFIAVSEAYAGYMDAYLGLPRERTHVVPLGIRVDDFRPAQPDPARPFTIGYLARIAPEKGLHLLVEGYARFRAAGGAARLLAAGYLAPEYVSYLETARQRLRGAGLAEEFEYQGELDREAKLRFLEGLDAFCVPPDYDDPKGIYLLEAQAAGLPVVAPERGALPEHIRRHGGGLLAAPGDAAALAAAFTRLREDPATARELGRQGREGVRRRGTLQQMAQRTVAVFASLLSSAPAAA